MSLSDPVRCKLDYAAIESESTVGNTVDVGRHRKARGRERIGISIAHRAPKQVLPTLAELPHGAAARRIDDDPEIPVPKRNRIGAHRNRAGISPGISLARKPISPCRLDNALPA
jgi:hypothetical protein